VSVPRQTRTATILAACAAEVEIPAEYAEDIARLAPRLRLYACAILSVNGNLTTLSEKTQIATKTLAHARRQICRFLGHKSALAHALYPKLARALEIMLEVRCERCGLRGHDASECDLPGIDFYALSRYD
jgi:hypothetical protein